MPKLFNETLHWNLARVAPPAVAQDGSFAIVPVRTSDEVTGKNQTILYRIDTRNPQSEPVALTAENTSSAGAKISPDQRWLAFLRQPSNEQHGTHAQLHLLDLKYGGEARMLGHFPLGVREVLWFSDSKRLCVVASLFSDAMTLEGTAALAKEREKDRANVHVTESTIARYWDHWMTDGEVQHLFELAVSDAVLRDLTPSLHAWFDLDGADDTVDLSPDGESLAFSAFVHTPEMRKFRYEVFVLSLRDLALKCISKAYKGDSLRPRYSPDGTFLVYAAKDDVYYGSNATLRRHSLADQSEQTLCADWDRSPDEWEFASNTLIVGTASNRGRSSLFQLSLPSDGVPSVRWMDVAGSSHGPSVTTDGVIYFAHDSLLRPPEIARVALNGANFAYVTTFNDKALAEIEMGAVEERELIGAHGDPVQYWLVHPPKSAPPSRGLVQMVHGGPNGYFGDTWSWRWNPQLFAAHSHLIAMVNFHGSVSFGEKFARSVLGDWGGAPATDIHMVTDALIAEKLAESHRVAVAGGSYGGYMAAWLVTQTQRFACAIAHAPVTDFQGMFGTDVLQGFDEELGAWPWAGPEGEAKFFKYDPMTYVGNVSTPVMVVHGAKDYRVPYSQGLGFYGALKARGVTARLVVFPGENHWILQRENSLRWYHEVLGWLDRFLPARLA